MAPSFQKVNRGDSEYSVQLKMGEPSERSHIDTSVFTQITGQPSNYKDGKGVPIWIYRRSSGNEAVIFDAEGFVAEANYEIALRVLIRRVLISKLRHFSLTPSSEFCKDKKKADLSNCKEDFLERAANARHWAEREESKLAERQRAMARIAMEADRRNALAQQQMLEGFSEIGSAAATSSRSRPETSCTTEIVPYSHPTRYETVCREQ